MRTVVVLICLWKLSTQLLRMCRVRVFCLSTRLFKGSANCTALAVAQRLYLSKQNLFWGYFTSRGQLYELFDMSCLGIKPGCGFGFSILLQALHPYRSKEQTLTAHINVSLGVGHWVVYGVSSYLQVPEEWVHDSL